MDDSILTSIKKLLGIPNECDDFDKDIIIHINSIFMILNQMGIGSKEPYSISSLKNTWNEFIQDSINIESVKTYIYLKVKLIFDPPISSFTVESIKNNISELEWRLMIQEQNNKEVI